MKMPSTKGEGGRRRVNERLREEDEVVEMCEE